MQVVDTNGNAIRSDSDVLDAVPVETTSTDRLKPRQLGTGTNRGEMTIMGVLRVVDETGTVRILIGFDQDGF